MLCLAKEADGLQLIESFFKNAVVAEEFGSYVCQFFNLRFIELFVDGKVVKHVYNVHSALIVGSLRLPTNENTQYACKSKIIIVLKIIFLYESHSVNKIYYLTYIAFIKEFVVFKQLFFFLRRKGFCFLSYCKIFHEILESTVDVEFVRSNIDSFAEKMVCSFCRTDFFAFKNGVSSYFAEFVCIFNAYANALTRYSWCKTIYVRRVANRADYFLVVTIVVTMLLPFLNFIYHREMILIVNILLYACFENISASIRCKEMAK